MPYVMKRPASPGQHFRTGKVARSAGCKAKGSCKQRTYTCLLAKAGKELTLVHCSNTRQTTFIRFEFGS